MFEAWCKDGKFDSQSEKEGGWADVGDNNFAGEVSGRMPSFLSSVWPVRRSMDGRLDGLASAKLEGAPGELE